VPTLAEAGIAGVEIEAWFGAFARAEIPPAARVWLSEGVAAHFAGEGARTRLLELGLTPARESPGGFATRVLAEGEKWAPLLRANRQRLHAGES